MSLEVRAGALPIVPTNPPVSDQVPEPASTEGTRRRALQLIGASFGLVFFAGLLGPSAVAVTLPQRAAWHPPFWLDVHPSAWLVAGGVHAFGEGAKVVVEEGGIDVQRHRGRGVAEHPLDQLDVRPARHRQRCRRVSEIVRGHVGQTGCLQLSMVR